MAPPAATPALPLLARFMREATAANGYLGGVTLVMQHGRIVDWQAYGRRDLARHEPMPRDAIFRLYSMTKTIASVAALILVEEHRLSLDDSLAQHLPAFRNIRVFETKAPARPITLRHLMTHTAGFATGGVGPEVASELLDNQDLHGSSDLADYAARVAGVPLGAEPGTRFGYDGVNIEVLARVVEVVTGEPFDAFVTRRILLPLRMVDTGWRVPESQRARIAEITTMGPARQLVRAAGPSAEHPGEPLNPYPSGAGGLYSTAADYARFCQMLLNGGTLDGQRIIGRSTVDAMMTNQLTLLNPPLSPPTTSFSPAEGFGLGGSVVIDAARRGRSTSLGAFGWPGAASTTYTIDPTHELIAVLLLQHLPAERGADLPRISNRFYNLVYGALVP